jgi:hypothetical protein
MYNVLMFRYFTDTNQRLEMSVGSLSNMRQDCETLREELRVLSEKLLKQHDAAMESQVLNITLHCTVFTFCSLAFDKSTKHKLLA